MVILKGQFFLFLIVCACAIPYSQQVPSEGGNIMQGTGEDSAYGFSSQPPSTIRVDIGNKTVCNVTVRRSMLATSNYTQVTTSLANAGGLPCILDDFAFVDVIPPEFASMGEISFTPAYFSRIGPTVVFVFPSFSPGESGTLLYTIKRAIPASKMALLNSTRVLTATRIDNNISVQGEPAAPQLPPEPRGPCTPEIYCAPFDACADGYRTQKCVDIQQCPLVLFYQVEPCASAAPEKEPGIFAQIELAICSSFPALCTGEQQDRAAVCAAIPAIMSLSLLAAFLIRRRQRQGDGKAEAA